MISKDMSKHSCKNPSVLPIFLLRSLHPPTVASRLAELLCSAGRQDGLPSSRNVSSIQGNESNPYESCRNSVGSNLRGCSLRPCTGISPDMVGLPATGLGRMVEPSPRLHLSHTRLAGMDILRCFINHSMAALEYGDRPEVSVEAIVLLQVRPDPFPTASSYF
jgi:hypothetical protein